MSVPWLLAASGFAANWAIRRLKERLTFPRTGYVRFKDPGPTARALAFLAASLSAAALAALITAGRRRGFEAAAVPAIGIVLSLAFAVASLRQKAPHLLVLAAAAFVLGVAFAFLRLGWDALKWFFLCLGAAAALLGAWRLRAYLSAHLPPLEERP